MTRLTISDKDIMVRRIIDDLPEVKYNQLVQQKVEKFFLALLPKGLLEEKSYLKHLTKSHGRAGTDAFRFGLTVAGDFNIYEVLKKPDHKTKMLVEWIEKQSELAAVQCEAHKDIRRNLRASFAKIATHAAFKKAYPDLAKYLPRLNDEVKNLPSTTVLVDSLKSAGLKLP